MAPVPRVGSGAWFGSGFIVSARLIDELLLKLRVEVDPLQEKFCDEIVPVFRFTHNRRTRKDDSCSDQIREFLSDQRSVPHVRSEILRNAVEYAEKQKRELLSACC